MKTHQYRRAARLRDLQQQRTPEAVAVANADIFGHSPRTTLKATWAPYTNGVHVHIPMGDIVVRLTLRVTAKEFMSNSYRKIDERDVVRAQWRYAVTTDEIQDCTDAEAVDVLNVIADLLAAHPDKWGERVIVHGDFKLEARPNEVAALDIEEPTRLIHVSIGVDGWPVFEGGRWCPPPAGAKAYAVKTALYRRAQP